MQPCLSPLVTLLQKENPFYWGDEQQSSFKALKSSLIQAPILIFPDFSKTFYLYTDASDTALGSILAHLDENGVDHPIAYYSKVFSKAEKNYSVTK